MPDFFDLLHSKINVSRETCGKLKVYRDLLLKWQPKINLISADSIPDLAQRHFLDSLQLLNFIPDKNKRLADFGSGAGFPGMALAIAGMSDVHLIESDGKKVTFLQEVARITETNISIHRSRIEDRPVSGVNIIAARALSDLNSLLTRGFPYVSRETFFLFPKSKNYSKEIDAANLNWSFNYTAIPSITEVGSVILRISDLTKRGKK